MNKYFLLIAFFVLNVNAQNYHWAGVGFLGDYSKRDFLYPSSSKVFDDKKCDDGRTSCFEVYARNLFKNKEIAGGKVVLTQAEQGTNSIGVALGISYERLIVDKTPDSSFTDKNTLNNIVIFGNLIFMDLDSNKLLGSVPTYISYQNATKNPLTTSARNEIVEQLLTSDELNLNLANDAISRAKSYELPSSKVLRTQISKVSMNELTQSVLGISLQEQDYLTMQMAQILEGVLMSKSSIQMLPSKVGHVVGGKLKTRLSSGNRIISLPEPDISLVLELSKLAKFQKPKSNGTGDTVCYASKLDISAKDSFGDHIMDASLKNIPCQFLRKGTVIEDLPSYEKSIVSLLSQTGKALASPKENEDFFDKASPEKSSQTKMSFFKLNQIMLKN